MHIDNLKPILLHNSLSEIEAALTGFDLGSFDKYGNNILHYYVKSHDSVKIPSEIIIPMFVDRGIDVNARQ